MPDASGILLHPAQPPGAIAIICSRCQAVTDIPNSRNVAPPPPRFYQNAHPPPPLSYSLYTVAPSGPPRPIHHFKKGVICGISCSNSRHELRLSGCINDARCMSNLLFNRFHFPESCINLLNDEETNPHSIPTKYNLWMALRWLVLDCRPGDSLVFHYSGHGVNDILCPMDFKTLTDDEINAAFVRPLPRGVKFHAIIDVCYNGTVLELPFLYRINRSGQYGWEDHRSGVSKRTCGGEAISFSGCDDNQTSVRSRITSNGAITFCFIQAIEGGHGNTYGSILNSMRSTMRNIDVGLRQVISFCQNRSHY